jgi:hypothetical protein
MSTNERRAVRYAWEEPVRARWSNGGVHESAGVTRDVSRLGAFFYCDYAPDVGAVMELLLTFPAAITAGRTQTVFCRGRVVRVEPPSDQDGRFGVALEFESLHELTES